MKKNRKIVKFDKNIFLRGEMYWYRGTPDGCKKREEFSLGVREGATQKEVLRVKKAKLEQFEKVGPKGSREFPHVFQRYLAVRERENLSDKTLYEVKAILGDKYTLKQTDSRGGLVEFKGKYLGHFLRNAYVHNIDQALFNEYCERHTGITLITHAKVLNTFLKWCSQNGYLRYRIEIAVPKFAKKEKRQRAILTNDEVTALISSLAGRPLLYHCLYVLLGMRNMEICKLRWDDISIPNRTLRINPMNNRVRKARVIPINDAIINQFEALYDKNSDWVFPSKGKAKKPYRDPSGGYKKHWQKALALHGIDRHLTPHDMRATFEVFMHMNPKFTDTQREKMAGAKIDVQKNDYVTMSAENLRGLEDSVQIEGLNELLGNKIFTGAKCGAKRSKTKATK